MVCLEHIFAAGIRFDTEIEYPARSESSLRYYKLPVVKSGSAQVCALTSVMQCVLVLGRVQRRQLTPERKLRAQRAPGWASDPGSLSVLRCIRVLGNLTGTDILPSVNTRNSAEMGETILGTLRSDGLCLLEFKSAIARRWATVIGVEVEIHPDKSTPRALLLLDSQASEPWACAHNVRIELKLAGTRQIGASSAYLLTCRHLTGEASKARLLNLITLKPAVAEPLNRIEEQP